MKFYSLPTHIYPDMNGPELRWKTLFLLFILFSILAHAAGAPGLVSYTLVASENGAVLVLASFPPLELNASRLVHLPLPGDAGSPVVSGALYSVVNRSLLLSRSNSGILVAFRSNQLTEKHKSIWNLSLPLSPGFPQSDVRLLLPRQAILEEAVPAGPFVLPRNDSLELQWNATSSKTISVSYSFPAEAIPSASPSPSALPLPPQTHPISLLPFLLLAFLILLVAGYAFRAKLRPKLAAVFRGPPPAIPPENRGAGQTNALSGSGFTAGQSNILRTLTEGDVKIVEALFHAGGEIKRFELEKQTGLAKSSLALSLRRLEEKHIVAVERNLAFQRVRLSEWFAGL